MIRMTSIISLTMTALALASCSCSDGADKQRERELEEKARVMEERLSAKSEKADEVFEGLSRAISKLGEKVETASSKDLKAVLPVELPGMTRIAYSASKKGVQGFSVSHADARFEDDSGSGVLEISVTDIGNISGFAAFGLDVLDIEVDEENQDGFRRTGDYKGHKSFQQSENIRGGTTSEFLVFVEERFVVRVGGQNVDWDLIDDVMDSVELRNLEKLLDN